jgi:integrase
MGVKVREKPKSSGVWWIFVNLNGNRTSQKIGGKREAEQIAKELRAKIARQEFDLEQKDIPTFKKYSKTYLETYSKLNHKQSTIDSYESILENHILPKFGKIRLDKITRKDVKNFVLEKQKPGPAPKKSTLSPNTVKIIRAYLSSILTQAVDDELIPVNPAATTGRYVKKQDNIEEISPLSWGEKAAFEKAMLEHFPFYYPFFICALRTGMREGELIALKPGDIDFRGGFIEVRRNSVRGRVSTPKTGKSRRIMMSPQLTEVLKKHITDTKKLTLKRGWVQAPEWLFYNRKGNMIDINNLRKRVFYKTLEKAKLRRINLHDLRHSWFTLRIAKGDNIADVSKEGGHSSIRVTVDTYYHWTPQTGESNIAELDSGHAPERTPGAPGKENQQ